MSLFEGSFLGDASKIADETRLECGVCWWVYDPAKGDDVWQIAPGTPFTALPSHWRCPHCDAAQHQFMALHGEAAEKPERPERAAGSVQIEERAEALLSAYRIVEQRIRALPVHNAKLDIQAVGFRRSAEGLIGVVATPWCMNLTLLPLSEDGVKRPEGSKRMVAFPSGKYEFITGHLTGVGPLETCSLFSPMDEFDDPDIVALVAEQAMTQLFDDPAPDTRTDEERLGVLMTPEKEPVEKTRRAFLSGGDARPPGE